MRGRIARSVVTAMLLAIVLLPIYWMMAASLKSNKEITQDATLYPHAPSLDNYRHLDTVAPAEGAEPPVPAPTEQEEPDDEA